MLYLYLVENAATGLRDLVFAEDYRQAEKLFLDYYHEPGFAYFVAERPDRKRPGLVARTGPLYAELDLIATLTHERRKAYDLAERGHDYHTPRPLVWDYTPDMDTEQENQND
jgi:hypothetical protein